MLGGCTEYEYTSQTAKDVFQQVRRNRVDIVLTVDNSGSMFEEQDKLASNFDAFIESFAGVDVDWQMAVLTTDNVTDEGRFRGGEDEIELVTAEGMSVDRVAWDRSWGLEEGVAWELDPTVVTASGNDSASAWCAATQAYNGADLGTPGEPNTGCGARGPTPPADDPVEPGAPRAPERVGEVLITEFMADPSAVADVDGEWVELTSQVGEDLDLSGCVLQDDGRNAYTFPEGTILPAGQRLVLVRTEGGGVEGDLVTGDGFTLNNNVLVLTPDMEGADEIFAEMVAVGIWGSGLEMGLESLHLAFTEPNLSGYNAGFLRDDANLSIIALSDEDDTSPYTTDQYLTFLTELKGEEAWRDHNLMKVSAVVGMDAPEFPGQPSCTSDDGQAEYGSRWVRMVERTEGLLDSICDEDFSPIAQQLGLTVSGLEVEFALSQACDESSLVVSLYETPEDGGFVRVLEKDLDYAYVAQENKLHFEASQVPPSEWYVVAEYRILAEGTIRDTGEPQ